MRKDLVLKVEQAIIIALPPSTVFEYRSRLQNSPQWQHDVLSVELTSPMVTGLGAGAIEQRRGLQGTTEVWELEITAYEPDRLLQIVGRCGDMQFEEQHVFRSAEGTHYTLMAEFTGARVPSAVFRRKTIEGLIHLKWRLEEMPVQTA
jgi:hypothetical protein